MLKFPKHGSKNGNKELIIMITILVPTDFSDHALFALKVAASITNKKSTAK